MKPYVLRRRDDPVAVINLSDDGAILDYKLISDNEYLAPLHMPKSTDWLKKWWMRRSVPISQGHIKAMLEAKGITNSEEYLVRNLGLSLTDYYWISPIDSGLKWKDVNLFRNDFHDDINITGDEGTNSDTIPHYTPNSSIQGSLEKCWTIRDGKRGMVKGNCDNLSSESINEVIATKLHELQGFSEYTPYELIAVHKRPYMYGCFSEIFTSERLELISAYDVEISEKKRPDVNVYEHFINVCSNHGLKESVLRPFLEYQIMTDFILSNRDRHLSNIAVLRDADTLDFVKPAPIFDTGKSLFVATSVPATEREMLKIETDSFMSTEVKLLSLVRNRNLVDVGKLPTSDFIKNLYSLDEHIDQRRIDEIVKGYEMKVDLFSRWQKGKKINLPSGTFYCTMDENANPS